MSKANGMSNQQNALRLALEALKELNNENSFWWQEVNKSTVKKLINAEETLEEALAQSRSDVKQSTECVEQGEQMARLGWQEIDCPICGGGARAFPKQEQRSDSEHTCEPVAWMFQHEETGRIAFVEAQQLEWGFEKGNPRLKKIGPLYTEPHRAWIDLTDQDFIDLSASGLALWELWKAIARKLKEKNT